GGRRALPQAHARMSHRRRPAAHRLRTGDDQHVAAQGAGLWRRGQVRGAHLGARMAEARTIEIEVLRYNPEKDTEPHLQSFQVPFADDTSVLQGLQYIKDHLDGSLTFRWSCRMAICGSCGKMVNGVPELSCHKFLREYYPGKVKVEPLSHFPIIRDLVIDQTDVFDHKLPAVKPYLVPADPRPVAAGHH